MTITRQALSLVEKAEPVQVRFTLCSRDQRSKWMQDECKVYMVSYMTLNGSCFMVTWTIFKNRLLKVGMTQNRETMALRTLTTGWFILFYQVWGSVGIDIHWNGMWLKDPFTYDFTLHLRPRGHTRWFWRCVGTAFGHFLLGSHNFMVTALGSCVKWPSGADHIGQLWHHSSASPVVISSEKSGWPSSIS